MLETLFFKWKEWLIVSSSEISFFLPVTTLLCLFRIKIFTALLMQTFSSCVEAVQNAN